MTPQLEITVASGADLVVRRFTSEEAISQPFSVSVWARIADPTLDLEAIAGKEASFRIDFGPGGARAWNGVVSYAELTHAEHVSLATAMGAEEGAGLSTYYFRIVPTLWLLTQRRNHRIFQHVTVREIVDRLLDEWRIARRWDIDEGLYPPLEYRVQWGESDFTFLSRMLEEAGISYLFADEGLTLVLTDAPEEAELREGSPTPFVEGSVRASHYAEYVTHVELGHEVRPGAFTFKDYDFRRPAYALSGAAEPAPAPEDRYEQYHYQPGVTVIDVDLGEAGPTPVADDRGWVRSVKDHGERRAQNALLGERAGKRAVSFEANFVSLVPGDVFSISGHPQAELDEDAGLLVIALSIACEHKETPRTGGRAAFAADRWRPRLATPKPRVRGVHAAIVVGPPGDEIAPDELGRVRVQFPWDREGKSDELSSCWMHVAEPWGGLGYGMIALPRLGQEVLVDFQDGDPDRPVVVGRVFNATQPVPYRLPEHKTKSTWKSDSSLGSNGFNEILYEDKKKEELVSIQAERNLRKLVKNDEIITVVHDREKHVLSHETDSTRNDRTEVTLRDRTQETHGNKIAIFTGEKREHLVKQARTLSTEDVHMRLYERDVDVTVSGARRERLDEEVHLRVLGERRERVDGKQSLKVGEDRHEVTEGDARIEARGSMRVTAGWNQVWDAADAVTVKGAGGFLQIDGEGVTIVGKMVRINAGGAPGTAPAAQPDAPAEAGKALVDKPALPAPPPAPELKKGKDGGIAKGREDERADEPAEKREEKHENERVCEILKLEIKASYVPKADASYERNAAYSPEAFAKKAVAQFSSGASEPPKGEGGEEQKPPMWTPSSTTTKLKTDRRRRHEAIPDATKKKLGKEVVDLLSRYDLVIEEIAGFSSKNNEEFATAKQAGKPRAEIKSPPAVAEIEVEAEYEGACPQNKHVRLLMRPANAPPNPAELEPAPVNGAKRMMLKEVEWPRGVTKAGVKELVAATFDSDITGGADPFTALWRVIKWIWSFNESYDVAFIAEACGVHSGKKGTANRDLNAVVRVYRDISVAFGVKVPFWKPRKDEVLRDTSGKFKHEIEPAKREEKGKFELYFKLNEMELKLQEYKPGELRDKAKEKAEAVKKAVEERSKQFQDWRENRARQAAIQKAIEEAFDDLLPLKDRLQLFFDDFVGKVRAFMKTLETLFDLMKKAPQLGFKLSTEILFLSGDVFASGSLQPVDSGKKASWPLPDRYAPLLKKIHLEAKLSLVTVKCEASFGLLVDGGVIGKIEATVGGTLSFELALKLAGDFVLGQSEQNAITVPLSATSTVNLRARIEVSLAWKTFKREIGIESGIVADGRLEWKPGEEPGKKIKATLVVRSLETGWYFYANDLKTGQVTVTLHKLIDGRPLYGPISYP